MSFVSSQQRHRFMSLLQERFPLFGVFVMPHGYWDEFYLEASKSLGGPDFAIEVTLRPEDKDDAAMNALLSSPGVLDHYARATVVHAMEESVERLPLADVGATGFNPREVAREACLVESFWSSENPAAPLRDWYPLVSGTYPKVDLSFYRELSFWFYKPEQLGMVAGWLGHSPKGGRYFRGRNLELFRLGYADGADYRLRCLSA